MGTNLQMSNFCGIKIFLPFPPKAPTGWSSASAGPTRSPAWPARWGSACSERSGFDSLRAPPFYSLWSPPCERLRKSVGVQAKISKRAEVETWQVTSAFLQEGLQKSCKFQGFGRLAFGRLVFWRLASSPRTPCPHAALMSQWPLNRTFPKRHHVAMSKPLKVWSTFEYMI